MLNPDLQDWFERSQASQLVRPGQHRPFQLQDCSSLADDMRFCLEEGVLGSEDMLAQWISHLQEREDSLKQYAPAERVAVFAQTIELVMLAQVLRNAGQLQEVMRKCLAIALPADLHSAAEGMLQKVQRIDKGRIRPRPQLFLKAASAVLDVGFISAVWERLPNVHGAANTIRKAAMHVASPYTHA